jgi:hypothetical protein
VLLPYNFITMQNSYYSENFNALQETCRERNVAVQTIKSIALRHWSGRPRTHTTWYEPLEEQADIDLAVWYVLGRAGVFLNSASDLGLLAKQLDAAGRFPGAAPDDATMTDRTAAQPLFVSATPLSGDGCRQ